MAKTKKCEILVINQIAQIGLKRFPAERYAVVKESKDPWAILLTLVLGGLVGLALGQARQSIKAQYRADRVAPGVWQVTQLPAPEAGPQWSLG